MKYQYREFVFDAHLPPFEVFRRLEAHCDQAFILESLGAESEFSRFTYIGAAPAAVVSSREYEGNAYTMLRNMLPSVGGLPAHYHGGLVGYVSYDGTAYFEPAFAGRPHPDFPRFEFGLYLDGFLFDKCSGHMKYFTLAEDRRRHFEQLLGHHIATKAFSVSSRSEDTSWNAYEYAFERIQSRIRAGDVFQAVLSTGTQFACAGDPAGAYQRLREINPSPHMYCLKFGKRTVLGASPELLFRTEGNRIEHFGTLAGTVRRGMSPEEDARLAQSLRRDEKELAEHAMLVDLARNDVGKISRFGSVRVDQSMAIKRFSHVQHLSTEIRGTVRKGCNSFDVLAACAPAGTLTGAPKIEAMKIIAEFEKSPRGPYGGSVGYFSVNGDAMFAIAIRSLFVAGARAFTRSGSGIVADSVCEKEYEEIVNKQKAIEEALLG